MHPFFDPRKLSDEELFQKLTHLNNNLIRAHMFQMDSYAIQQLQTLIDLLNMERSERLYVAGMKEMEKVFKDVNETDPDLAKDNILRKQRASDE